jgi:hypothetical protein
MIDFDRHSVVSLLNTGEIMITLEQAIDAAKRFNMSDDWTFFDLFKTNQIPLDYTDPRFVRALFDILERYPDDDGYEAFQSILHLLEKVPNYETELAASLRRQPSLMTELMVSRILNSKSTTSQFDWISLLREAENHPSCPERVRKHIKETIHRNTDPFELRQRALSDLLQELETSQAGWEEIATSTIEEIRFDNYIFTYRVSKFLAPLYGASYQRYFARILPKLESYSQFEYELLTDIIPRPSRFNVAMIERLLKNPKRKTSKVEIMLRLDRVRVSIKCPPDVRLEIEGLLNEHQSLE